MNFDSFENNSGESGGLLLPLTILVADDEEDNRIILRTMLEEEGYRVILAKNGQEALRKASLGVDMILMDIDMPILDGLRTCAALQARSSTREIPVLFLSAFDRLMIKNAAQQAGAFDYLEKPIDPAQLFTKVRAVQRLIEERRGYERRCYYASTVQQESARERLEAQAQLAQWNALSYGTLAAN